MMPTGARSIRLFFDPSARFREYAAEEQKTLLNRAGFFCPLPLSLPHVCSTNIIRDIFSNAKCNFSEAGYFYKVNTI
jgi:hypothetical protein